MREVLHSFLLGALVEGKRFCHGRWVMDDPAVATLLGLDRVRGEDALPRLGQGLDRENLRRWMNRPQTELYAALPDRFMADWDGTVNTRLMGLNPGHHTEAIKSRRSFLFMAAQVVESGRQRTLKLAVKAEWWQVLSGCHQRLRTCGWRQRRRSWKPKATFCAGSPVKPPMIPSNGSLKPHQTRPVEVQLRFLGSMAALCPASTTMASSGNCFSFSWQSVQPVAV